MILVIDLDKTLLNDEGCITEKSVEILNSISKKHNIIIASQERMIDLIALKNKYDINVDLASVVDSKALINNQEYENKITEKEIKGLLNNKYIYTAYSTDGFIYNFQERLKVLYPKEYTIDIKPLNSLFISIYNEGLDELLNRALKYNIKYIVIAKDFKKTLVKFSNSFNSKLEALSIIKKYYPNNKVAAITDSINDYPLLEASDISIAMINGDKELKEKAQYITELDNNHDGCMLFLDYITKLQ